MAYFPLFVSMEGRHCLVVGGGKVALRKVRALLEYGADLTLVAPKLHEELETMGRQGVIKIRKREFRKEDLEEISIVFAASSCEEVNQYCARLCREQGILVNVADVPKECDFYFPALVRRGDLVVGISTGGKSPAAAGRLRRELENYLPMELEDFIVKAGYLREEAILKGEKPEENQAYQKLLNQFFDSMHEGENR